jgi:hypothetical protein
MTPTEVRRELRRLYLETGDVRFANAIEAIADHFGDQANRGRRTEWTDFALMVLWIAVQARMRAFDLTISAACHHLAKHPGLLPIKRQVVSAGTLERVYHTAVKRIEDSPDDFSEADTDADGLARILTSERASQRLQKLRAK